MGPCLCRGAHGLGGRDCAGPLRGFASSRDPDFSREDAKGAGVFTERLRDGLSPPCKGGVRGGCAVARSRASRRAWLTHPLHLPFREGSLVRGSELGARRPLPLSFARLAAQGGGLGGGKCAALARQNCPLAGPSQLRLGSELPSLRFSPLKGRERGVGLKPLPSVARPARVDPPGLRQSIARWPSRRWHSDP